MFCLIVLLQSSLLAQSTDHESFPASAYTSQIEGSLYKGFIMMHDEKIGHLIKSHPQGFRISYIRNTYGAKYWEQAYGYPDLGISFSYQNYLNPILGKSLAIVPFLNLYLYRGKISSLSGSLGTGLAYHTNPHDQKNNNSNLALGSSFSAALYIALKYQVSITNDLSAGMFVHMDHYSNGAIRKPNSGINLIQTGASFSFNFQKQGHQFQKWPKKTLTNKKFYLTLLPSISFKEVGRGGGVIHPSYNLNVSINHPLSWFHTINFGVDGFYDIALKKWIEEDTPGNTTDFKSAAITLGHQLMIGKISFLTQLGYHVYRPYTGLYSDFYQRYGLRIHLHPHIAVSGSLKTYLGKAEHVEWGLLFRL
ncbi:acyloxyacyl hydrolase [Catalinimonas niigatensis]|uniref:acyloxyacyl hydrolase n=1 Tax=Catalinimonas niigatensis TaxID=1397264 RepID=UPI00266674EB|nr:acyloxyacyl hydrolase [Catalinimonas niigatensis]WPP50185.1 acyloxyacyl hydrolase [Catalinimonas niigatensis]